MGNPKPPKRPNPHCVRCIPGKIKGFVWHFKNAAARREAGDISDIRTARAMLEAVNSGRIPHRLIHRVQVKTVDYTEAPKPRSQRKALPAFVVGKNLDTTDFVSMVIELAQLNPSGFRQPSSKAKNWASTSLVERLSIEAGMMDPPRPERSTRGLRKLEADAEMKRRIIENERDPSKWPVAEKYMSAHARRRMRALQAPISQAAE